MSKLVTSDNLKAYHAELAEHIKLLQRNTAYALNDIVNYDGITLKCTTAGTTNTTKPNISALAVGSTYTDGTCVWTRVDLDKRGIDYYVASKDYEVDDQVVYNNKIYRCITAHTSTSTFDSAKWQKIGDEVFTGATSSSNGEEGIVPQPTTSDISKFLCGDGTWKSAGGSGIYVNRDVLFSGSVTIAENAIINLTNPYINYDYLLIEKAGSGYFCVAVDISEIASRAILFPRNNNSIDYILFTVQSTTQLKMVDVANSTGDSNIYRITGIKFLPNPNIYSTTEQEIGTWIDGKPLYQVTLSGTTNSSGVGAIDFSSYSIDQCVSIDGYIFNSNGGFHPLNYNNSTNNLFVCVNLGGDKFGYMLCNGSIFQNRPFYITIKYTKV